MTKTLAWIEVAVAAAFLMAACAFVPGLAGGHCTTQPCTYYAHGQPEEGVCGAKKTDARHCYCFAKSNKKLWPQAQSGCSASRKPKTTGRKGSGEPGSPGL
ncbi:MAG: hypothetical protein ACRD0Y_12640 [Terriglobales bacterium]